MKLLQLFQVLLSFSASLTDAKQAYYIDKIHSTTDTETVFHLQNST